MNETDDIPHLSRKEEFWQGVKDTLPLVIGAIPFGIIFGALAITSGISSQGTIAMSLLVFAGSSQFIAAGLVATGASMGIIILTTFIVNLRHALYAATLAPYMKDLSQRWLIPLGFWLTDESFVVVVQRYRKNPNAPNKHWYYLGSAVFMYTNWQLCTYIGLRAGQTIPDPASWGLDFALIVTFIGMLIPLLTNRPTLLATLAAGVTALLANGLANKLGLMLALIVGIAVGLAAEKRWPDMNKGISDE